ncbi:hypothetical protein PInf_018223 [Phytophthora infestans]|nr:hypothetical protein PInf_018223 [Phytophthora infestans]
MRLQKTKKGEDESQLVPDGYDPYQRTKLLDACVKVLSLSNTVDTAISIGDSQSSQATRTQRSSTQRTVKAVAIKDAGNSTRRKIEIFKRIQNSKTVVQNGIRMHKWLVEEAIAVLPAEHHDIVKKVVDEALETFPYELFTELPNLQDYDYAMLYSASPSTWLTDAAIRALCWRLSGDYPTCKFAGFQSVLLKSKRTRNSEGHPMDGAFQASVLQHAADGAVETVLLPLNFNNFHWCCVVTKVKKKRIYYYDPLKQAPYMKTARGVATNLKISGLQDFNVIAQINPIQLDGFSCGVYVCWMLLCKAVRGLHVSMSDKSLTRRRVELFLYLIKGRLLPLDDAFDAATSGADDDEEKPKAPSDEDNRDNDEEIPSTIIAALTS